MFCRLVLRGGGEECRRPQEEGYTGMRECMTVEMISGD